MKKGLRIVQDFKMNGRSIQLWVFLLPSSSFSLTTFYNIVKFHFLSQPWQETDEQNLWDPQKMPNKQNKKEAGSDLFEKSELSQDRVKKKEDI